MIKDLFGTEGVSAVLAYINTAKETTDEMFDFMKNSQGSSAAAFEKMSKTLSGQLNAIQGAFQAFTLRIGRAAASMLAPFVNSLPRLVDILSKMPDEQVQMLIQLGLGFVGLTAGVLALGKAISILGSLSAFLAPIGTALADGATLSSLFLARLAPIATVFNHIKNVALVAMNPLFTLFAPLVGIMTAPFRAVRAASGAMFGSLRSGAGVLATLQSGFSAVGIAMGRLTGLKLSNLFSGIGNIFASIKGRIGNFVSSVSGIGGKIAGAVGNIVNAFRQFGGIRGMFVLIMNGFRALSAVFVSNPIGLALLAIGAVVLLVASNWKGF